MKSETLRIDTPAGLLAAVLTLPDSVGYTPGVVMDCDLAGCADPAAQWMAKGLAERGWAVLQFDHLGFGNSGGPRQHLQWSQQCETLTTAYWWLRKHKGIDGNRVGIWGKGLGAWRLLDLITEGLAVKAAVTVNETVGDRRWVKPLVGLDVLLQAGFFDDDSADLTPLLNPRWLPAWGQLLRAPKPKLTELHQTPIMRWLPANHITSDWSAKLSPGRVETHQWPTFSADALALQGADDPTVTETHGFLLQHL